MPVAVETSDAPAWTAAVVTEVARLDGDAAIAALDTVREGLSEAEAGRRRQRCGPNALRSHRARPMAVLARQFANPLLLLLLIAAAVSVFLGEGTDAVIIVTIVTLSVGLSFLNEYRSERAVEALHAAVRHEAVVRRGGVARTVDVTELVPGDIVTLRLGEVVPADIRLLHVDDLECSESALTGEPASVPKTGASCQPGPGASPLELGSIAFMGTVVAAGGGEGVVVATGAATAFGAIAAGLGERHPPTAFQQGLASFSRLLAGVAGVLCTAIFIANVMLGRPVLDALLFSLAIAIGITPQLLPAVVTVSLSTGARRLSRRAIVVKRLVVIEDLGNMQVLFTDKTGTLTDGHVAFQSAIGCGSVPDAAVFAAGLACTEGTRTESGVVGANALDAALWSAPGAGSAARGWSPPITSLPFDHDRRLVSVLVEWPQDGRMLVTKGAPEAVLERCQAVPPGAQPTLDGLLRDGARVVAVGRRSMPGATSIGVQDERDLELLGFLAFADRAKTDAGDAIRRLEELGVTVKVVTGDHPLVAEALCRSLGMAAGSTVSGAALEGLDDAALAEVVAASRIFARVTPLQKARIIRAQRLAGTDVGFLGDGVNDAVALHAADVGISVDTATDVAKDAADVVLVDKSLGVIADAIVEGRKIFANTVKYVLMATSSNIGNMVSAGVASVVLDFLPMLPSQILVNNLLYDTSQLTIPTDHVDAEQLARPAHWDIGLIRRFMLLFGPISSAFDALTFVILLAVLHASDVELRSGWFVESLATQTLVIFVIRTRRVPWWRSRASRALTTTTLACTVTAILLPYSPLAGPLGFTALPVGFLAILVVLVACYLTVVEVAKAWFFRPPAPTRRIATHLPPRQRRTHRRAARFSTG